MNARQELSHSLELAVPSAGMSEEEFLQLLADAVDYWMQHRMEQLMSLCYTLDVEEPTVAAAFHPAAPEPANVGLAKALYARQLARLQTKHDHQPPVLDDEDAW